MMRLVATILWLIVAILVWAVILLLHESRVKSDKIIIKDEAVETIPELTSDGQFRLKSGAITGEYR